MNTWKDLIDLWGRKNPGMKVLNVPAHHNLEAQHQAFMRLFEAGKASIAFVVISSGGLPYHFHGDARPSSAEWLGIPSIDIMVYIKGDGRVTVTGTGTAKFQALMSSKAADPYGHR